MTSDPGLPDPSSPAGPGGPTRGRRTLSPSFLAWWVGSRLVTLLDRVVPASDDRVVLHSYPDLDDNIVAMLRSSARPARITILANDVRAARARVVALKLPDPPTIVAKASPWAGWVYARAGTAYSTHGLFLPRPRPRGKRHVGLWHGEFGKAVGTFDGERMHPYDWMPVSSALSRERRMAEFELTERHIHVVGLPRQEPLLAAVEPLPGWNVVYVPTYRRSVADPARADGDEQALTSLSATEIDVWLEEEDAYLWWRPHPLEPGGPPRTSARRLLASNDALQQRGMTFYELLARSQCLVTDYSSVWIDYLLTGRPLVGFCPDLDSYRSGRGLALEPHEHWFPGPIADCPAQLLELLEEAKQHPRRHAATRLSRRTQLHQWEGRPSHAAWAARQGGRD